MNSRGDEELETIKDVLMGFRAQALCIKTNVQILKELWSLQANFKEKNAGGFYQIIQENCIFRIALETYKMLYDQSSANTIFNMINTVYEEMKGMEAFKDRQQELLDKKKEFSSIINTYNELKTVIVNNRKKVYAHNDREYHWFSQHHIDLWGMNDDIYENILEVSEVCINYCNALLEILGEKCIYEYSNYDDIKRLFGIKTKKEEICELFYGYRKDSYN